MGPSDDKNLYLQPMTAVELFAAAFQVYRDHVALLVLVGLLPHLVMMGVLMVLPQAKSPEFVWATMALGTVLNGLVLAALTVAIAGGVMGEDLSVREVYRRTFRSHPIRAVGVFLAVNLAMSLPLLLGLALASPVLFLAGILPGLFLGGLVFPALPIVVLERYRIPAAIVKAVVMSGMAKARALAIFSFYLLISGFLPLVLLGLQNQLATGPFTPLLGAITAAVTLPLGYAAVVLFYFSLHSSDAEGKRILLDNLQAMATGPTAQPPEEPPQEEPPQDEASGDGAHPAADDAPGDGDERRGEPDTAGNDADPVKRADPQG